MFSRFIKEEFKWVVLSLFLTFFLVFSINNAFKSIDLKVSKTFLGLNLFLEILVFFAFSAFVVFGVKGFFERYSHRYTNVILLISGVVLAMVIFILSYQILLLE